MLRAFALIAGALGAVVVTAACSSSSYGYASTPLSGQTPGGVQSNPSGMPQSIDVKSSPLGTILVDGSGRTLYLFEADGKSSSSCYGSCAAVWPPVLSDGIPTAGSGVNQSLLSITTRSDGTREVTYNGHPLYYFVSDKVGQTTGQGLNSFGADWYVLSPAGDKVDNG